MSIALHRWLFATLLLQAGLLLAGHAVANDESLADERVTIVTELGNIEVQLFSSAAPLTVANFLRHIDAGHYDGTSFYRTVRDDNQVQNKVKIEVIQGGRTRSYENDDDFTPIALEPTSQTGLRHTDRVISMARDTPDSATTEFFICINDQPALDYGGERHPDGQGFAAFGRVTKGMQVVQQIHQAVTEAADPEKLEYTSGQMLLEPVTIKTIFRNNTEQP